MELQLNATELAAGMSMSITFNFDVTILVTVQFKSFGKFPNDTSTVKRQVDYAVIFTAR